MRSRVAPARSSNPRALAAPGPPPAPAIRTGHRCPVTRIPRFRQRRGPVQVWRRRKNWRKARLLASDSNAGRIGEWPTPIGALRSSSGDFRSCGAGSEGRGRQGMGPLPRAAGGVGVSTGLGRGNWRPGRGVNHQAVCLPASRTHRGQRSPAPGTTTKLSSRGAGLRRRRATGDRAPRKKARPPAPGSGGGALSPPPWRRPMRPVDGIAVHHRAVGTGDRPGDIGAGGPPFGGHGLASAAAHGLARPQPRTAATGGRPRRYTRPARHSPAQPAASGAEKPPVPRRPKPAKTKAKAAQRQAPADRPRDMLERGRIRVHRTQCTRVG